MDSFSKLLLLSVERVWKIENPIGRSRRPTSNGFCGVLLLLGPPPLIGAAAPTHGVGRRYALDLVCQYGVTREIFVKGYVVCKISNRLSRVARSTLKQSGQVPIKHLADENHTIMNGEREGAYEFIQNSNVLIDFSATK